MSEIDQIITLDPEEKADFESLIKKTRKSFVSSPKETIQKATICHQDKIKSLIRQKELSEAILFIRENAYLSFLKEEYSFNGNILKSLSNTFQKPKNILQKLSQELFAFKRESQEIFYKKFVSLFGEGAGRISPYIYQLCLSNTQSRRSRAGKVFEEIIYFLYEWHDYAYESQASIGKKVFASLNLGKVVDSVLPNTEAFRSRRNKTIVGSMKTSLRERWQEVVEEISRSNLPNIHLLTLDTEISAKKAEQMSEHNIVLVTLRKTKEEEHLKSMRNIIDFEAYFYEEIPNILDYWAK